ncbi:MAG: gliding motility-associated C-terminal domain-containing protein [Bacteroidales bacterium]|nr:gliding motility-associated C-terminal domain-containing protein [Bacteroidales bacterium]
MKTKIIIGLLLLPLSLFAEGTKQLKPDSTYPGDLWITNGGGDRRCFATDQCDPDQKLFIHIASPGEKIFMGFNAFGDPVTFKLTLNGTTVFYKTVYYGTYSKGCILYHSQAAAGPLILDPSGYDPVTFVPTVPGDYSIEFIIQSPPQSQQIAMQIFDITVIDTTQSTLVAIDGRLWSKNWGFNTYNNTNPGQAFLATQYILTSDSIITALNYNHMRGWNFDVTSTRNGCFPWPSRWDSSCMSRHGNHHYAEYKIFVSNPDTLEYPTGTLGNILGDTVGITRNCDGTFQFSFAVNKRGDVNLTIESNLSPGIQPEDLTIKHSVLPGINTLHWDGLNALGEPVPCGDSVAITMNYINGLTNIALYDVETHPQGFIIDLVRPSGLPIATYWNDTLLANDGGSTQLDGCYAILPDSGCHKWTGGVGFGLGSQNTVNTWWYAASSLLDLGRFRVECVPLVPEGITGPATPCTRPIPVYTVDPNPLPGCESAGYEWVLTDLSGSVLFDSVDAGPSIGIDFLAYPAGPKRLKIRGWNNLCGEGSFGPGSNGEGIRIDPVLSPMIINNERLFSICSGDTTNILLQSDIAGTTFSYSVQASSSNLTGQTPGTQNPVRQQIFNIGTTIDSVVYSVVPFVAPCYGDTVRFVVSVSPLDTLVCLIQASSNPVCEGSTVTLRVDPPVGGPAAHFAWRVNGATAGSDSVEYTYTPMEGDTVQCFITSEEFCTPNHQAVSNSLLLHLQPKVPAGIEITPSAIPVCEGDSVIISANAMNGGLLPTYRWWLNGIIAGSYDSTFSCLPDHNDQVICQMISNHGCLIDSIATDTLYVMVAGPVRHIDTVLCSGSLYFAGGNWQSSAGLYYDTLPEPVACISVIETNIQYQPEIMVNLGEDKPLCNEPLILNAFFPGAAYLWQDGSSDSIYLVTEPGVYYVHVYVDECSRTDSIVLDECPIKFWIPTAFTPNGDGLNDTFHPVGTEITGYSMKIFNRWGEMIFETRTIEPGWDGTCHGEPCKADTYVYLIHYKTASGEYSQVKGNISLIR